MVVPVCSSWPASWDGRRAGCPIRSCASRAAATKDGALRRRDKEGPRRDRRGVAAPRRAEAVRRRFVDRLTSDELGVIASVPEKVVQVLDAEEIDSER